MKGGYTMSNETKYTLDNIHEFFDSLDNAPNPNIHKMVVWAGYERDRLLREELRNVEKIYESKDDNPIHRYIASKISDNIYIVEYMRKELTLGYFPCVRVNKDYMRRSNTLYKSFDQCLLAALSILYTSHEEAGAWAFKLIASSMNEDDDKF